ncbi:small metal-binding protein SmbP [Methylocaldum sp. MU1018]
MRRKMLIGLFMSWFGLNATLAAEAARFAPTGSAGTNAQGRAFTKKGHLIEAWKHAEAAVLAGEQGNARGMGEQAKLARAYVEAALTQSAPDEHLTAAMKSLDNAVEYGDANQAGKGRQAAQEAIDHLRAAKK